MVTIFPRHMTPPTTPPPAGGATGAAGGATGAAGATGGATGTGTGTAAATSNIDKIKAYLKSGKYIPKLAGLTALALVFYDANHIGNLRADMYASTEDANTTGYYLNNTMYSTSMSKVQNKIKMFSYRFQLNDGWRRFFNLGTGYCEGFMSMLINHVIPLTLGTFALITKGMKAKLSTVGLGIYAMYEFIKNFFGIGVPEGIHDL